MVKVYYIDDEFVAACPDCVVLPDMGLDLGYKDGYTFLAGVNKKGDLELVVSDTKGNTHNMMNTMYILRNGSKLDYVIEGRFFELANRTILTIWNDFSSMEMKTLKLLFRRNDPSYDISNWIFATEFDEKMAFTCTINEFISLGFSSEWGESDKAKLLGAYEKSNKLQPAYAKSTNGLGFSDRDYMRHYLYQEGKINESRVTDIVYHFTDMYIPIIKSDAFQMKKDDTPYGYKNLKNKYPYFMSTTRRRNDAEGYSISFSTSEGVKSYARFTLDGRKINNQKDLVGGPYDWFYAVNNDNWFGPSTKQTYIDFLENGEEAYPGEKDNVAFTVQSEDRIWSNKPELTNFSSFVTRVDILLVKGELSTWVNIIKQACEESTGDWKNKVYIYKNRNDFNAQNNNCFYLGRLAENRITVEDIKYMVNEVIKKMTNSEILYRGGVSKDYECLWLTTSRDYAENYGEVLTYEVPIAVLDNLACEEDAMDYLIDEEDRGADPWSTEEFYLYDRNLFDIKKMKAAGYTGYYYHEQEYKCINVCLFRDTQYKLIQQEKPQI